MSRTKKGSPKLGSVPKVFKKYQNKSQKMSIKENVKSILLNQEGISELQIRKTHAWEYF
jgi:hypothetical protein